MEPRVAGKPDTIMIQLVSQQPSSSGQRQAMPISVQAIPLFPGPRATREPPRRPAPMPPNMRAPAEGPPRMHSRIRPEMCVPPKRQPSQNQLRGCGHRYSSTGLNQPPPVCYVLRPEDRMVPIYIPATAAATSCINNQGGRMETKCPCCGRSLLPEEDDHPRESPDRRDQGTNTNINEPIALGDLKMICETLGRAMVSAAVDAVQKSQLAEPPNVSETDSKYPMNILLKILSQLSSLEHMKSDPAQEAPRASEDVSFDSKRKASFSQTVRLSTVILPDSSADDMITDVIEEVPLPQYDDDYPVEYPKTPRASPDLARGSRNSPNIISPQSSRLLSGSLSTEGITLRNSNIVGERQSPPRFSTRKSRAREQASSLAATNGHRGPSIRRRLPTESIPPLVKNKKSSVSKSQKQKIPVVKQSKNPDESTVESPLEPL
ncbi:uncharacterized protein LOC108036133 [Drosophila biarmipes]|uniref:uncharacterized protein LOC108036133 n=1 Tax=Drosophila biarmipes TaxID=125945 RepID=UPI0007E71198|nr:uncharacterized protein LOC108036133 [Drosophila biarmipes]